MIINNYTIKTIKEAAAKYRPCEDWCAEFDCMDTSGPVVVCQFDSVYANSLLLELPLYSVKNQDEELPSCIVDEAGKTIAFKIAKLSMLLRAMA